MDRRENINNLVDYLNKAGKAYYVDGIEMISNFEYDRLYDELVKLEEETGIVLSNSPTVNVGYKVIDSLHKETHEKPMLSLNKTKEIEELKAWLGKKKGVLSWKIDGLTVVLTYKEGKLLKGITRGNGEIGEVITNNAFMFKNLPISIPFKGELVVRGEAFIKYSDFEKINTEIPEIDAKYKNPRNLCSGSVRQLNNEITANRNIQFEAFAMGEIEEEEFNNSYKEQLRWLENQGFETVSSNQVTIENIEETINKFAKKIGDNDTPSDGLVLTYDDIEYGKALGNTSKFPRNAIAFKWKDEVAKTKLLAVEWSTSRTGLINPIAIFEPVELEGTTVSRASVHNVSLLKELKLGIGDCLNVYKANMIIPQIAENITKSGPLAIPENCLVCNGKTTIKRELDVETLVCLNPECPAKKIKSFALFVSRNAINIENLSEATLEKFIKEGLIKELPDIFSLKNYKEKIESMEGFGEKSYKKLINSIDKSRKTTVAKLLYSLGIQGVGVTNAKLISRAVANQWENIENITMEKLIAIDGIGEIVAKAVLEYFQNKENKNMIRRLLTEIILENDSIEATGVLAGKVFVITGNLFHFANRDALKEDIENKGGRVSESISSKTSYLINNEIESSSSKNKKAKKLGIEIISEEEMIELMERN